MEALMRVEPAAWLEEVEATKKFFSRFGRRLPQELTEEQERLAQRLNHVAVPGS